MKTQKALLLACIWLLIALGGGAVAGPVVVTPGSLSSYTYFPPPQPSSGNSGDGGGENVSTLQRCLWSPTAGQQTVKIVDEYSYNKPFLFTYTMAGGNGGGTIGSGGGGSSAILKSGEIISIAKGGDGGVNNGSSETKTGIFKANNGESIEFITGGGGGLSSVFGANYVGAGGGAGFMGGGGGGTIFGRTLSPAEVSSIGGKGGGDVPGSGGYVPGGFAGTTGSGRSGGVATSPDGSTAPVGNAASGYYRNAMAFSSGKLVSSTLTTRHPATATTMGSPANAGEGYPYMFSGGGGKLGTGGTANFSLSTSDSHNESTLTYLTSEQVFHNRFVFYASWWQTMHAITEYATLNSQYLPHDTSMSLTRALRSVTTSGTYPIERAAGSLPGQIIIMYQAPVCGILR